MYSTLSSTAGRRLSPHFTDEKSEAQEGLRGLRSGHVAELSGTDTNLCQVAKSRRHRRLKV